MKIQPHLTILAFAVILIALSIASCKDDEPNTPSDPCTTCQSVMEAKDYFYFKMGSWWVYEEETSHERDSMYVTLSENDPSSYDFETHIKSDLTDYTYYYWPVYFSGGGNGTCSPNGTVNKRCVYVKREKGKFQNNLGNSYVFFVKYSAGDYIYTGDALSCPNNKLTISAIMDSLVLPNYTFSKVIRVDHECSPQEGKQPITLYYKKGVGIIKKELIDSNQVWNLMNYHIQE